MEKQKEFEILVKNLAMAHHHFALNQIIHQDIKGNVYKNHEFLWEMVLLGLEQSYLTGLAKFFERPSKKHQEDTISAYYFYSFDFDRDDLLNQLRKIRNKMISHYDKNVTETSFLEELRMNPDDVSLLFRMATEAVEKLKEDLGYVWEILSVRNIECQVPFFARIYGVIFSYGKIRL